VTVRATLALAILLLGAQATARAQDVQVDPREVDEGRPVTLRVAWIHSGTDPAGLLALEVRATRVGRETASASHSGPSHREALWLDGLADEALTLEVEAREELGAQARAPRPPLTAGLRGEPSVVLRQVVPGESVGLTLEVLPLGDTVDLEVVVRHVTLRPDLLPAGARLYVQGPTHVWRPGAPTEESDPLGAPTGPDADPLGLRPGGGASVNLIARLTRWIPRGLGPSPEVLVRRAVLDALTPIEARTVVRVKVRPAAFGCSAALAAAATRETVEAVVRLADDRWVFQSPTYAGVVTDRPSVVEHAGFRLFPWVLGLARDGRAGLTWYEAHEQPDLANALKDAGFVTGEGKGLMLEVTTESLSTFLGIVAKHDAALRDGRIEQR
jgi:hypothetical protein